MKRAFAVAGFVILTATWAAYALCAKLLAGRIAEKWGPQIIRAGDGKFSDAARFLQNRILEATWLVTLTFVLAVVVVWIGSLAARRMPQVWKWIPHAAVGFLGLNVWLKIAATTCLFWCSFWNGKGATDNLTQFQIKLLLMDGNRASTKVVLAGSSQVFAQIDHRLLDRQFGSNFASTPLYYPGNHGSDFVFLNRQLKSHRVDIIVCYLSEMNFFEQGFSEGFSLFFTWRELPEFLRWGADPQWSPRPFAYGLLSDTLPLFRLRDPVAHRCLGSRTAELRQREYISSLVPDLHQRAIEGARRYRAGAQSQFEMAAFEDFVAQCRSRRQTVVLCCGQLNPLLAAQIDRGLRLQMLNFLHKLASKYDHVVLLEESALPAQTADDYEDLTHVNHVAQIRFTEAIGHILDHLATSRARPG